MIHTPKYVANSLSVKTSNLNCMDSVKQYLIVEIINVFSLIFISLALFDLAIGPANISTKKV